MLLDDSQFSEIVIPEQCARRELIGGARGQKKTDDEEGEEEEACAVDVDPDLCNCFGKHSLEQYNQIAKLKDMLAEEVDECVH